MSSDFCNASDGTKNSPERTINMQIMEKIMVMGLPVAHHLDEAWGLQVHKDLWDDFSSAQHTLQAISLQDAVQLRQEEEHEVPEKIPEK